MTEDRSYLTVALETIVVPRESTDISDGWWLYLTIPPSGSSLSSSLTPRRRHLVFRPVTLDSYSQVPPVDLQYISIRIHEHCNILYSNSLPNVSPPSRWMFKRLCSCNKPGSQGRTCCKRNANDFTYAIFSISATNHIHGKCHLPATKDWFNYH